MLKLLSCGTRQFRKEREEKLTGSDGTKVTLRFMVFHFDRLARSGVNCGNIIMVRYCVCCCVEALHALQALCLVARGMCDSALLLTINQHL